MVRVTCMRCGRGYSLTNDQIVRAVEESRGTKHKHYVVNCPYCRQVAKVPLRPIRQTYARLEALGALPPTLATEEQTEAQEEAVPAVEGRAEEQGGATSAAPAPEGGAESKPAGD
jgi:hypothetical protein